jgi:hypothetical protein
MSEYNAFFGSITIDDDNDDITVDGGNTALTQGDYYMYSPNADESFLDHFCDVISAEHGATVSYSISDSGILTLSSASSVSITFANVLYEDLGFTSAAQSGIAITAENKLEYCWFPEMLESDSLAPVSSAGKIIPVTSQQQAADKNVWTTKYGEIVRQTLTYEHLEKSKAWKASSPDNSSLEEWLSTTYYSGRKMIFVPGFSDDESVYWYYCADLKQGKVDLWRTITGSDLRWGATLYFVEVDA